MHINQTPAYAEIVSKSQIQDDEINCQNGPFTLSVLLIYRPLRYLTNTIVACMMLIIMLIDVTISFVDLQFGSRMKRILNKEV